MRFVNSLEFFGLFVHAPPQIETQIPLTLQSAVLKSFIEPIMVSYLIALRRAIPHIEIGFGHPDDAYLVYVYERQVDGGNWRGGFVKSYHGLDELIPSCAVLEIDTNPSQEKEMIDQLELYARGERRFRLVSENCSSYVAAALRPLGIDENQTRTWYGASFPRKLFALAQKKFSGDGPIRATTLSDFRFNGYRWG